MVEWLAGNRIRGTNAERTTTAGIGKEVGGWVEVGRTTLASSNANLDVSGLADKRYYMILSSSVGKTAAGANGIIRFNNDSSGTAGSTGNYSARNSNSGATDTTQLNQTGSFFNQTGGNFPAFEVAHLSNLATREKLWIGHEVQQNTAGANPPIRNEHVGKWANTSSSVNQINNLAGGSDQWLSGSEIVILGWDDSDTHTTNFWEELASVELGSAGDNLSSGTITAKKYLWFQAYIIPTGGSANCNLTFNNDTDQNYSLRYTEGTNEQTLTGERLISMDVAKKSTPFFINGFVINNSANEKLTIIHQMNQSTATAGYAPTRNEIVGKWSNTSAQITEIDIDNPQVGVDYNTGSILKVWGHD